MSEYTLFLWIKPANFAQHVERDPRVATKMINVHLAIITNFFSVMAMRISAKNNQVIPYNHSENCFINANDKEEESYNIL